MTSSQKTAALVLLAATQFVLVLDASIVNVALPSITTSASPQTSCPGW
jgi:hypothetical protein